MSEASEGPDFRADKDGKVPGPGGTRITPEERDLLVRQAVFCRGGPVEITDPLASLLEAGHELLHWIGQQIEIALRLDETIGLVMNLLPDTDEARPRVISYSRSIERFAPLSRRVLFEKIVDLYLVYIGKLVALIYTSRPETLKSSAQVRIDFVLDYSSMSELIRALAEEQVAKLAYKGMRELSADLESKIGLHLFMDSDEFERAVEAIEVRNILVHNDGVVSRTMARRLPKYGDRVGEKVDTTEAMDIAVFLAHAAIGLDARAVGKFRLPVRANPRKAGGCRMYVPSD